MRIGRYRFIRDLGSGGMARISLCVDERGRLVVVKQPLADGPDVYAQLLDEARAGKRVHHPNVVETLEFFQHGTRPCLAVAYVPGGTLYQLRRAGGALPQSVVARVGRQISEALAAIHAATDEQGKSLHMLHRDISPSNIVLGHDGNARLIDLGIARSAESCSPKTRTGLLRGKIHYFAPELFDDGQYTAASDLWALGVVLFEAALGRHAVSGAQPEVMGQICAGRVFQLQPGEQLDPSLMKIFSKILAQKRNDRLCDASEAARMFGEVERAFGASQGMAARVCQARIQAELPIVPETPVPEVYEPVTPVLDLPVDPALDALASEMAKVAEELLDNGDDDDTFTEEPYEDETLGLEVSVHDRETTEVLNGVVIQPVYEEEIETVRLERAEAAAQAEQSAPPKKQRSRTDEVAAAISSYVRSLEQLSST